MANTLEVSNVSVHFGGVVALDDVSFNVGNNEIVGLIGPNGAGKTTLLNVVSRFVTPTKGTIQYKETALLRFKTSRLAHIGIGRTLQGIGLWPRMSVLENVVTGAPARTRFVSDLLALPAAHKRARAREQEAKSIMERVGIIKYANAFPSALPHGVRKRVALARALMAHPLLLLLDEPASGLSDSDVAQLVELLGELRKEMSIALIEHNLDMVMKVSDRICVLNLGRVIATGSPQEIRANEDVKTAYMGNAADA